MTTSRTSELGRYGGQSGAERLAARRERLLDAGLELFGGVGFAATSVKAICIEAGLTERYFYESFRDREDLFLNVYERVVEEAITRTAEAMYASERTALERARAGLGAYFGVLGADIRKGRVLALEVVGVSSRLDGRRRRTMHDFAAAIIAGARSIEGDAPAVLDENLMALGLVGAVNELMIVWLLDPERGSLEPTIEHCAQMFAVMQAATYGRN